VDHSYLEIGQLLLESGRNAALAESSHSFEAALVLHGKWLVIRDATKARHEISTPINWGGVGGTFASQP